MNNFSVEIIGKKKETHNKRKYYRGKIIINDFNETFLMSVDNWTIAEYQQQWREALERLDIYNTSCLVVNIEGSLKNPWIELWVLYKENNIVFIQNHCLFHEIFQKRSKGLPSFDAKTCYLYLVPRTTTSNNGKKISEWTTDTNAINDFLKNHFYKNQA